MSVWFQLVFVVGFSGMCFVFFFSSRRRHTRSKRDWSSDVCSSDLSWRCRSGSASACWSLHAGGASAGSAASSHRSEERRVGKECRSRWATDDYKKKGKGEERGDVSRTAADAYEDASD